MEIHTERDFFIFFILLESPFIIILPAFDVEYTIMINDKSELCPLSRTL